MPVVVAARQSFLSRVLGTIPVEQYDVAVANRRTIVTTDRSARFGSLPGVECFELPLAARPVPGID